MKEIQKELESIKQKALIERVLNPDFIKHRGIETHIDTIEEIPVHHKNSKIKTIEIYKVGITYRNGKKDNYYVCVLDCMNLKGELDPVKRLVGDYKPTQEFLHQLLKME